MQILHDHVDHTRFDIVEMECQMVQLLYADIVGPTVFDNLTPAEVQVFQQQRNFLSAKPIGLLS